MSAAESYSIFWDIIPNIVSVDETAGRVGITVQAVRGLIARKRITAVLIGGSYIVYWPSVVKYYANRTDARASIIHSTA